jgi:hypothetical protein
MPLAIIFVGGMVFLPKIYFSYAKKTFICLPQRKKAGTWPAFLIRTS